MRLREVRLVSGLILGAFLVTHFGNHALGLVSVGAMEEARRWFNLLWRNPLGTILLYGALLLHFVLALQALYRRRTLRMPFREAAQLTLGLVLPFLLIPHVTGTRIELALTGREADYPEVIRNLWTLSPESGARQAVALVIAWLHGCLGVYFWLRPKPWFHRYALGAYTGALLVPLLALLGFAEAGKTIAADPDLLNAPGPPSAHASLSAIRSSLYLAFGSLIGAALAARAIRVAWNWSQRLRITYPGGRVVSVPRGFSVLEASRTAGIMHPSVCGGRGRCSTCRVRVLEGLEGQPDPTPQERATLARIKAGPDVRLGCQFRPARDVSVVPVLSAARTRLTMTEGSSRAARGQEREIAVLFCDLRGFTSLTERRLPFDTVFLLNRYFEVVGHAVDETGGHLDKFIGDGALALFGLSTDPEEASRQAVEAALRVRQGVADLNAAYGSELDEPLQIAMSLHAGPAIVGEMGYGNATNLTAVGDTLNAASRLEELAKELDAELVISDELARLAALRLVGYKRRTLTMRGRTAPLDVWIIPDTRPLSSPRSG
ncbi:adenylate/guanylate cyclase domain-containing protein [Microvirga sp. KLBC 81]|uniref:adenylate/guanylate cyclase domain-containing protein n=1 Tax=Microvirga sp. KLBC 81 TaxID=1862707 RepID=UPI001FE1C559|nr:adenylate/guanylate cyclase domain-containing protein [Microvirga sp. KLBC 81]